METLILLVNGSIQLISNSFKFLLYWNYLLGSFVVQILNQIFSSFVILLQNLFKGIFIGIEDFSTFLQELYETFSQFLDFLSEASDGILGFFQNLTVSCQKIVTKVLNSDSLEPVLYLKDSSIHFMKVLGSSLITIIKFPYEIIKSSFQYIGSNCTLDACLGFICFGAIVVWVYSKFLSSANKRKAFFSGFVKCVCLFYFATIWIFIETLVVLERSVGIILSHIHFPGFRQAGEDRDDDDEEPIIEQDLDGDNPAQESSRSTFVKLNNLIRLRAEAGKNVQDLLIRQVELEREDKLCVVCQDKEKCIIILPCKHLCICQDCHGPIIRGRNGSKTCPICRRSIRKTIKAYM